MSKVAVEIAGRDVSGVEQACSLLLQLAVAAGGALYGASALRALDVLETCIVTDRAIWHSEKLTSAAKATYTSLADGTAKSRALPKRETTLSTAQNPASILQHSAAPE